METGNLHDKLSYMIGELMETKDILQSFIDNIFCEFSVSCETDNPADNIFAIWCLRHICEDFDKKIEALGQMLGIGYRL